MINQSFSRSLCDSSCKIVAAYYSRSLHQRDDFYKPNIDDESPLKPHVLYRLRQEGYVKEQNVSQTSE